MTRSVIQHLPAQFSVYFNFSAVCVFPPYRVVSAVHPSPCSCAPQPISLGVNNLTTTSCMHPLAPMYHPHSILVNKLTSAVWLMVKPSLRMSSLHFLKHSTLQCMFAFAHLTIQKLGCCVYTLIVNPHGSTLTPCTSIAMPYSCLRGPLPAQPAHQQLTGVTADVLSCKSFCLTTIAPHRQP